MDEMTNLPAQQLETQIVSESPMTHVSDALPGANINNTRVQSGLDMPLNQLDEVNESVNLGTQSNDDRQQEPAGGMNQRNEIYMENNSQRNSSIKGS